MKWKSGQKVTLIITTKPKILRMCLIFTFHRLIKNYLARAKSITIFTYPQTCLLRLVCIEDKDIPR